MDVMSANSKTLTLQTVSNKLTQLATGASPPFSAAQVSQTDPTVTTTLSPTTTASTSKPTTLSTTSTTTTGTTTNSTKGKIVLDEENNIKLLRMFVIQAPIDTSAYESQVAIGLTVSILLFLLIFFGCLFLFKYWESRQDPGSPGASPSSSSGGIGSVIYISNLKSS